ncbi:hypothetical protein I7I50_05628 [Histoplasma capsulatum G186AR]|uniref:Uncharacterized protein n=1 Tax=Ajellomyces capsulatus TaxID=5037 RepID=A0A8H7ZCJ1_AJECA|nr:hypothetical protein I7I52_03888 [Histoplasma capsulatum]QSS76241.1 hypothetical protein I7I50_05628 [Histoplasma capsulatum G186AR]
MTKCFSKKKKKSLVVSLKPQIQSRFPFLDVYASAASYFPFSSIFSASVSGSCRVAAGSCPASRLGLPVSSACGEKFARPAEGEDFCGIVVDGAIEDGDFTEFSLRRASSLRRWASSCRWARSAFMDFLAK